MSRTSDWSSFLTYVSASFLAFSDKVVQILDVHAEGIGALCQIVGVCIVILTYTWNKSCTLKRLKYYEEHFAEIFEKHGEIMETNNEN